nr:hypothetical protein HmN_000918300 [Hymenolepis microstoma]
MMTITSTPPASFCTTPDKTCAGYRVLSSATSLTRPPTPQFSERDTILSILPTETQCSQEVKVDDVNTYDRKEGEVKGDVGQDDGDVADDDFTQLPSSFTNLTKSLLYGDL